MLRQFANLALYVGIALCVVILIFILATYKVAVNFRAVLVVGLTAITFGYLVRIFRPFWKLQVFWLVFFAALIAHAAILGAAIVMYPKLPAALISAFVIVEFPVLVRIFNRAVSSKPAS